MANLERALQIAVQSHAGQKDKNGAAYIFHPIRVMMRCTSPNAKIVALLHDVVEDTATTFDQLHAEGFSSDVLSTLRLVTHLPNVPYNEYIDSLMADRTAIEVKLPISKTIPTFGACRRLTTVLLHDSANTFWLTVA